MSPAKLCLTILPAFFFAASMFQTVTAQAWPQWRGPNRDGASALILWEIE
jgi:hypothetical protein